MDESSIRQTRRVPTAPRYLAVFLVLMLLPIMCNDKFSFSNCKVFAGLEGAIPDSECEIEQIDRLNEEVNELLHRLLKRPYFKFYKTVLFKKCEFWNHPETCAGNGCVVYPCDTFELPDDIKCRPHHDPLGKLDRNMAESMETVINWTEKDSSLFCKLPVDSDDPEAVIVDLQRNPERFTGYNGESAWRIWRAIYSENCFWHDMVPYDDPSNKHAMCFENQIFHRVISGLHASINVQLCADFLFSGNIVVGDHWGYNLDEFRRRFGAAATRGEGTNYLKNMYFLYILELRAMLKAADELSELTFYASDQQESDATKRDIITLMDKLKKVACSFNESQMFTRNDAAVLKHLFSTKFVNITKIMDCVGCDKCRMWGRLQTQALGTALNILFAPEGNNGNQRVTPYLTRWNIVAIFNAFGRISNSVKHINHFRKMVNKKDEL